MSIFLVDQVSHVTITYEDHIDGRMERGEGGGEGLLLNHYPRARGFLPY